jgi:hypothetical protein
MSVIPDSNGIALQCDKCGRIGSVAHRMVTTFADISEELSNFGWYVTPGESYCARCMKTAEVVDAPKCQPKPRSNPDRIITHEKTQEAIRMLHDYLEEIPAPKCWEAKGALLVLCMRIAALEDALKDL